VLKAINDLLYAITYVPAAMRSNLLVSGPIPDYTALTPVLSLDTITGQAQVVGPFSEKADYSQAYNQFLVVGEDPRRVVVSAYYENRHPESPISLSNWHPRLLYLRDSTIASTAQASARARSEAQFSARIYSVLGVGLPAFPFFEDLDVVNLVYSAADEGVVRRNFVVLNWAHTADARTLTTVALQRVVAA
jgi:hypothetical protein